MVCYIIPAATAITHYALRKSTPAWKKNTHHFWLTLLLLGGAIFGIIDHWWNKELFLIGANPIKDLMLGAVITLAIVISWMVVVTLDKATLKEAEKSIN